MKELEITAQLIKDHNLNEEEYQKILDILEIPWIRKSSYKTAKLAGISFSDDHDKISFIIVIKF